MTLLANPDNLIIELSYPERKLMRDVSMHKFRAESMIKKSWGYVHIWKNGQGWQERHITRRAVKPLFDKQLITLVRGEIVPTAQGVLVVKRMEEMKLRNKAKKLPHRASDETGQYLLGV